MKAYRNPLAVHHYLLQQRQQNLAAQDLRFLLFPFQSPKGTIMFGTTPSEGGNPLSLGLLVSKLFLDEMRHNSELIQSSVQKQSFVKEASANLQMLAKQQPRNQCQQIKLFISFLRNWGCSKAMILDTIAHMPTIFGVIDHGQPKSSTKKK